MARVLTARGTGGSEPDHYMFTSADVPFRFSKQFTASAWVNFTDLSTVGDTDCDIVSKLSASFVDGWGLRRQNSVLDSYIYSVSSGAYVEVLGATTIQIGKWILCTATYDGQYVRIYYNDRIDGQTAVTGAMGVGTGNGPMVNGSISTNPTFGGVEALIEDIRVSAFGLSPSQVGELYRTNKWPDSVPLTAWWRCLGTSGSSIEYDYSGRGNHLDTLIGPPTVTNGPSPKRFQRTNIRPIMFSQGSGGGGSTFTISAAEGTYSLTGKAQTLNSARTIAAAEGTYTLTGKTISFVQGKGLSGATGVYSLTGNTVTLNPIKLSTEGVYTLTGNAQTLTLVRGNTVVPVQGVYTLVGKPQKFAVALSALAAEGTYTLTGKPQVLALNRFGQSGTAVGGKFIADMGSMTDRQY